MTFNVELLNTYYSISAKAIPSHNRHLLLNLFCQNNVDLIYSGKPISVENFKSMWPV